MSHQKAIKGLLLKFTAAFAGMITGLKIDRSIKGQAIISFFVILFFLYLQINIQDWTTILLCIALVLSLEFVNSSVETLSNYINQDFDPVIKKVKDYLAAAVLISAIFSGIIGLLIVSKYL